MYIFPVVTFYTFLKVYFRCLVCFNKMYKLVHTAEYAYVLYRWFNFTRSNKDSPEQQLLWLNVCHLLWLVLKKGGRESP